MWLPESTGMDEFGASARAAASRPLWHGIAVVHIRPDAHARRSSNAAVHAKLSELPLLPRCSSGAKRAPVPAVATVGPP